MDPSAPLSFTQGWWWCILLSTSSILCAYSVHNLAYEGQKHVTPSPLFPLSNYQRRDCRSQALCSPKTYWKAETGHGRFRSSNEKWEETNPLVSPWTPSLPPLPTDTKQVVKREQSPSPMLLNEWKDCSSTHLFSFLFFIIPKITCTSTAYPPLPSFIHTNEWRVHPQGKGHYHKKWVGMFHPGSQKWSLWLLVSLKWLWICLRKEDLHCWLENKIHSYSNIINTTIEHTDIYWYVNIDIDIVQ